MAVRARDWRALDAAHRHRNALITVLFDPEGGAFALPDHQGRKGRPRLYGDELIEALLTVKVILRLSQRALQGFTCGLARIATADWPLPHYSTLSRRETALQVHLAHAMAPGKKHLHMVDSTGLKVFGEGEWKVRQHGVDERRTWRKVTCLGTGRLATLWPSRQLSGTLATQ